ncbi:MAG: hypothetical protein DRO88_13520 [Promethearchaeia archaeon]|nr:MAG: hypothetical protein DRO88_13520 [Candidatus Lokiarchaeia archaeon]
MIIFDSSPLIHLTKIGKIEFVLKLFGKINIPVAVHEEVVEKGIQFGYSDAYLIQNFENEQKILKIKIKKQDSTLINFLHRGEMEVIQLAEKYSKIEKCLIVMDEKKGRLIAEQRNISYISTASLILLLLRKNLIDYNLYCSNLAKYTSYGWFSLQNYQQYIKRGKYYE